MLRAYKAHENITRTLFKKALFRPVYPVIPVAQVGQQLVGNRAGGGGDFVDAEFVADQGDELAALDVQRQVVEHLQVEPEARR